ncbi:MAG TPA: PLP-dependent aspartate aminotransferase family protein [Saprospiraceae bacterium]|nr:PLP-dependent aspartate aminotransferase family protein [Saprospiraceae bacterium]
MKFATKAVHAGVTPDPSTGAIMTPIYQTSTYVQAAPGDHKGFEYARTQNPTRHALEASIASLENGTHGLCFGSGMAAMDAIVRLLDSGDEVIACNDLYGGSYRLLTKVYARLGISSKFIDMTDPATLSASITPQTKLIWLETPTNPLLRLIDLAAVADIAKQHSILTCVDNTFATPFIQRPLEHGIDMVAHSATKYLAGHSDVVLGAVVTSSEMIAGKLRFLQNAAGAVPGPQDCFLTLRGIKTLHLRMERACANAHSIAEFLRGHHHVGRVIYPGLKQYPQRELAERQMSMPGAMISFDLKDDSMQAAFHVLSNTKLFALAESLGGVESLIGHPTSMTHASIPKEDRLRNGLTDSLIRLSIGIEDHHDLMADLEHALSGV